MFQKIKRRGNVSDWLETMTETPTCIIQFPFEGADAMFLTLWFLQTHGVADCSTETLGTGYICWLMGRCHSLLSYF
jgi:hypothetical protein